MARSTVKVKSQERCTLGFICLVEYLKWVKDNPDFLSCIILDKPSRAFQKLPAKFIDVIPGDRIIYL